MKRHQIRRMLPGNRSDAQVRRAIADLGLPGDDEHEYSSEEAKQILNQFRGPQTGSSPHGEGERLAQSQATAQESAAQTKVALVTNHQERLVALSNALDQAEQRRSEVLDRLSDRVAYLQDDALFMHDLLHLAQSKLQQTQQQQPEQQAVSVTALDAFVAAFDAVGDWELPAIAPHPCAGVLPP